MLENLKRGKKIEQRKKFNRKLNNGFPCFQTKLFIAIKSKMVWSRSGKVKERNTLKRRMNKSENNKYGPLKVIKWR